MMGRHTLLRHGISYERLSFRLPSSVTIEGLEVESSTLHLLAGRVEAQWSWRALMNGRIESERLSLADAVINLEKSDAGSDTTSSLPAIQIAHAALRNVLIKWGEGSDSSELLLRHATAVGLTYGAELIIDSLVNSDSRLTVKYTTVPSRTPAEEHAGNSSEASIRSIPHFRIGHLDLRNCDFTIDYGVHHYAITRFFVDLSELNNRNVSDISLRRLAFRFQDSLDVDIALGGVSLDRKDYTVLKNLSIALPGFRLAASSLNLSASDGFRAYATFDSSFVNTDLLRFVFPGLNKTIPGNTPIVINGGLGYHAGKLNLDRATLALGDDARLSATGKLDLANAHDSISITTASLQTSLSGISKWSGYSINAGNNDIPIQLHSAIDGVYSNLRTRGNLSLGDAAAIDFVASIVQQREGIRTQFAFNSAALKSKAVSKHIENDIRIAGLNVNGSGIINNGLAVLSVEAIADSLFTGHQWYSVPVVKLDYTPQNSAVSAVSNTENYSLYVNADGDVLSGTQFTCYGKVHGTLPISDTGKPGTAVYARFHGDVIPEAPATNITFDTLRFHHATGSAYTTYAQLNLSKSPDNSVHGFLSVDKHISIRAMVEQDFTAWLTDGNDRLPTVDLSMIVHADTTLVKALTGNTAHVEMDTFRIVSGPDGVSALLSIDSLNWSGFDVRRLNGYLQYKPGLLTGKIEAPELATPITLFEHINLSVNTDQDSTFTILLNTYMPEIERPLGLAYQVSMLRDSYRIAFADTSLQLGLARWQTMKDTSLLINRSMDFFSGQLIITDGNQKASLKGDGEQLILTVTDLDVGAVTHSPGANSKINGRINATAAANFKESIYSWQGSLINTTIDTVALGNITFNGQSKPDTISLSGMLRHKSYDLTGTLTKPQGRPANFHVRARNIDLKKLSSLLPASPSVLTVDGVVNGEVKGSYGDRLSVDGFVALPGTEVISKEYDIYLKSGNDSLIFQDTRASLKNFVLLDRLGNAITIRGGVDLNGMATELSISTERFRVLDKSGQKSTLSGSVDMSCDLRIQGRRSHYKVAGKLATLPGASVDYLYKSTVSLDDREREITFINFDEQGPEHRQVNVIKKRTRNPIEWDVGIDVGPIDVRVLFSQVSQDHIRTTASGSINFSTGTSAEPSAFGSIGSTSGDIAYAVPMISDLRMNINQAALRWVGDVGKPLISFNGSQIFRISPNEISSLWTNKSDRWPITVIARVNDRAFNDIVLDFDLSSTNNQVSDWIATLPPDTREAYAVSLLIRGRINTGGSADVNVVTQAMVSKMNEISSRNIKSADLTFYDESRGPNSPDGGTNKIGYNISKAVMNKKVRIVLGGSLDLSGNQDASMPDVKVEYVLREDPTVTLRAGKANVYTGVIDGNVDESSFGITYVKRFRNFFRLFNQRKKE